MSYKYNLAGALTQETYPSGRIVHHNYAADGKMTAVSSQLAMNKANKSYAQNFSYNAAGAVNGMQLGNMRWESTEFNSRIQPTQIALGTTQTGTSATDLLKLQYGYGTTANNGNVMSQTIKVEDVGATDGFEAVQTYTYDEMNRLKSATENSTPNGGSSSQSWKQTYLFDRFGNRNFDTTSGATTTIPGGCSTAVCNPAFNLANNRFAGSQGYVYDNAGNVTEDATGKKFVYDGENKQKSFGTGGDDDNGGTYVYDGDGRRVKKTVGSEVTVFVYDATGQMVAEYSTTLPSSPQINYLTTDTLGSPRINTDASGTIVARHDYMPFGEEVYALGNRSTTLLYAGDDIDQKFTGYQRDAESALDNAKARMFGSSLGRFSSPDPLMASAKCTAPQSWNRYSYAYGNPLRYVDPDGMEVRVLDDEALKLIKDTLPKEVRDQIVLKDGKIDAARVKEIKSEDPNFLALKELVLDKKVTEVITDSGVDVPEVGRLNFYHKSIDQIKTDLRKAMENPEFHNSEESIQQAVDGVSESEGYYGQTLVPGEAPVKNARVILPNGQGESASISYEQRVGTTGHELYGHGLLYSRGKPHGHGVEGGPTDASFEAIEQRSIQNYRSGLKTSSPAAVKPSN